MWKQTRGWNSNKGGKQAGMCLRNVRMGYDIASKYDDAWTAWTKTQQHKNRNYPAGVYAPIFFSYTATIDGVRKNYGHIGVRYPDGRFWSDGNVHASVEAYEKNHAPVFVGWGESVNDVRVIEEVKGGSMEKTNLSTARILTYGVLGRVEALSGKHDADLNKHHVNVTLNNSYIGTLHNSTEAKNWRKTLEEFIKKAGERDVFAAQVSAKDAQIKDLNSTLKIKDNEINRLNKEVESLKAQTGDNSKWETLKALIRELVGR